MMKRLKSIRKKIKLLWESEGQKPMKISKLQENQYQQSSSCHICGKKIISTESLDKYDRRLKEMNENKTLKWKRQELINLGPKGRLYFSIMNYIFYFLFK